MDKNNATRFRWLLSVSFFLVLSGLNCKPSLADENEFIDPLSLRVALDLRQIPISLEMMQEQIPPCNAQPVLRPSQSTEDLPFGFGKSYFVPNPFNGADAALLGVTAVAGGLAFTHDQKIMNAVQGNKPAFTNVLATLGNDNGQYAWIPVAAGLLGGGYLANDDKAEETGFMILAASAGTGLVAQIGKDVVGRERPNAGKGPYDFGTSGQSFPSGHTTEAATVATVISEEYGDHEWVPPLAYATVALTAYARMHDQAHWMSGTIAGFALGHFGAKYMMKILKRDGTSYPGLVFTPEIDPVNREYRMDVAYVPQDTNKPMQCSSVAGDIHAKIVACLDEAFKRGSK